MFILYPFRIDLRFVIGLTPYSEVADDIRLSELGRRHGYNSLQPIRALE